MILRWMVPMLLALYCVPAFAFDTGHHLDLTREALGAHGMSQDAIDQVCVANWSVDYYSYSGTAPGTEAELQKLHFDNLYTQAEVESYWRRITLNLKAAIEQASADRNATHLLALTGATLHATQDFYAHSNWCETHPRTAADSYRTETWYTHGLPANQRIYTGKYEPYPSPPPPNTQEHGDYTHGLNKDSHIRPRWDEAYVFAYASSRQTIAAIKQWSDGANPGFFNQVAQSVMSDAERKRIHSDLRAAYEISAWVKQASSGADGHWKGNRSGDKSLFLAAAARFVASPDSAIIHAVKSERIHEKLTAGLYAQRVTDAPPTFPAVTLNERALVIATTNVRELPAGFGSHIDNFGKPDFFCRTKVGDKWYIDRTIQNESSVSNPWVTIAFIRGGSSTTSVEIEVWDEEDVGRSPEQCDIHPGHGKKSVSFTVDAASNLAGDVNGRFDSPNTTAKSTGGGDGNLAEITFYCVSRALLNP